MNISINTVKTLIISFIFVIPSPLYAEQATNQLPMYGGENRNDNPELLAKDNAFIEKAVRSFGTREHASEGYVERGFDHFSNNEFDKSMERFNQAWLLNEKNPYVYLGFGLILNNNNQSCEAYYMFKLANEQGLKEKGFLADYAYTSSQCAILKNNADKQNLFDISNNLYNQAIETSNNRLLAYVYHSWAKSYNLQKNYTKSREMIELSRDLGGIIDNSLLQSLEKQLN
jgi:tetratricopeptide (TPR) repeat protein